MGMAAGIIKHLLMVTFGLSDLVLQIGCSAAQTGIIEFMNGLGSGHACWTAGGIGDVHRPSEPGRYPVLVLGCLVVWNGRSRAHSTHRLDEGAWPDQDDWTELFDGSGPVWIVYIHCAWSSGCWRIGLRSRRLLSAWPSTWHWQLDVFLTCSSTVWDWWQLDLLIWLSTKCCVFWTADWRMDPIIVVAWRWLVIA